MCFVQLRRSQSHFLTLELILPNPFQYCSLETQNRSSTSMEPIPCLSSNTLYDILSLPELTTPLQTLWHPSPVMSEPIVEGKFETCQKSKWSHASGDTPSHNVIGTHFVDKTEPQLTDTYRTRKIVSVSVTAKVGSIPRIRILEKLLTPGNSLYWTRRWYSKTCQLWQQLACFYV